MSAYVIALALQNNQVQASPAHFLGGDIFNRYRTACGLAGARWDAKVGKNVIPTLKAGQLAKALVDSGFELKVSDDLRAFLASDAHQAQVSATVANRWVGLPVEEMDVNIAGATYVPRPFQLTGIQALRANNRFLLTDAMGLGKTAQILLALPRNVPVLVICPTSLKLNWRKEAAIWRPDLQVTILKGRNSLTRWPNPGEMMVINYDILPDTLPEGCPPNLVVVGDEVHSLKNPKSARSIRFKAIEKMAWIAWGLTGTPLMNRPLELWQVLETFSLGERAYGSFGGFCMAFDGTRGQYAMNWGMPRPEAAEGLKKVSLGRRKEDVAKEIPSKSYQDIPVEIEDPIMKQMDKFLADLEKSGMTLDQVLGLKG